MEVVDVVEVEEVVVLEEMVIRVELGGGGVWWR